jgi:hypothetical protein
VSPRRIDLFVAGNEDALPLNRTLPDLGIQDGAVLFMLSRPGVRNLRD